MQNLNKKYLKEQKGKYHHKHNRTTLNLFHALLHTKLADLK